MPESDPTPPDNTPFPLRSVFGAVFIGTALIAAALVVNGKRPAAQVSHPNAQLIKAEGKCAACHRRETAAIVAQYETSRHAQAQVNCLQCHEPAEGQDAVDHNGFRIATKLTSLNCKRCHATEYEQFARSRHALPAYAAVQGIEGASAAQIAHAEKYHPGTVRRPANGLANVQGRGTKAKGCVACHEIGRPNADGSIGSCTQCHSRHSASVALARQPETCGQCHMGPDHSQLEIFSESKHGILFNAQKGSMNLSAPPKSLTTADMSVPTCATCHMSGLDGLKVSHDTTERLSWLLYAPVSTKRPNYQAGKDAMQEVCLKCHARSGVERYYAEAEEVVLATNEKVRSVQAIVAALEKDGLLSPEPFDEPIDFLNFDYWHYYGRTAKHGAFMGGADFVQWHGNYELLKVKVEIEHEAKAIREHGKKK